MRRNGMKLRWDKKEREIRSLGGHLKMGSKGEDWQLVKCFAASVSRISIAQKWPDFILLPWGNVVAAGNDPLLSQQCNWTLISSIKDSQQQQQQREKTFYNKNCKRIRRIDFFCFHLTLPKLELFAAIFIFGRWNWSPIHPLNGTDEIYSSREKKSWWQRIISIIVSAFFGASLEFVKRPTLNSAHSATQNRLLSKSIKFPGVR